MTHLSLDAHPAPGLPTDPDGLPYDRFGRYVTPLGLMSHLAFRALPADAGEPPPRVAPDLFHHVRITTAVGPPGAAFLAVEVDVVVASPEKWEQFLKLTTGGWTTAGAGRDLVVAYRTAC